MKELFSLFTCYIFIISVVCSVEVCRNGWVRHNTSCYLISKTFSDWASAQVFCTGFHGHLIEIETQEEDHYIKTAVKAIHAHDSRPPVGYWIGFTDIEEEDEYRWFTSDKLLTYKSWAPGDPDGALTENCGALYTSLKFEWVDLACRRTDAYFICEKEAEPDGGEIIG